MVGEFYTLRCNIFLFEQVVDCRPVETEDDAAADIGNGYAHLAGFFYGFLGEFGVMFDVLFGELYALAGQVVFGGATEPAPVGAINRNVISTHASSLA